MSMSAVNIIRIVALVLAVVGAFVAIPYAAAALVILGLVAGFMGVDEDRRLLVLVMAVALAVVADGLGPIPAVGDYLTAILTNLSGVFDGLAVAVILTAIYERITQG
ncbi:MAG: hypothetical protein GWM88_01470 [Pseudomonadales bacterium]|nr:hypothetical protein [Pseudomonadales bacterium]NIX06759.1 hypothetical protein [Pseudomonadales bacterium]